MENQYVEKSNYEKINALLEELGCHFKIEKSINFDLMKTLRNWNLTNGNFPFNRNKAFYFLAKEMENINHYKKNRILDLIKSFE